ncbi:protein of unknown function [Andreprevotia lacus DSM 23236]|jgi:hypothetical protein|uniref:DUF5086 domain-containing protein n=1 Tax=Andreprevotia lacus DSM 23236 TaxID=1121001 RepID=A0A1W1XXG6_9NEIS|nr:DUF5086 family protein [Andreprevotia lacus]SMC28208.1 protein of unknown function [Andreprevotia lacus DSM 23236]
MHHRHLISPLLALLLVTAPVARAEPASLQSHPLGIWALPPQGKLLRWVLIYDLPASAKSGIYHIEVVARQRDKPVWTVYHLAHHIAITEAALQRSVVKPLQRGGVYPENFEHAYAAWQAENGGKGGEVCQTDVLQCLPAKLP